jgi:hypothetical protein
MISIVTLKWAGSIQLLGNALSNPTESRVSENLFRALDAGSADLGFLVHDNTYHGGFDPFPGADHLCCF